MHKVCWRSGRRRRASAKQQTDAAGRCGRERIVPWPRTGGPPAVCQRWFEAATSSPTGFCHTRCGCTRCGCTRCGSGRCRSPAKCRATRSMRSCVWRCRLSVARRAALPVLHRELGVRYPRATPPVARAQRISLCICAQRVNAGGRAGCALRHTLCLYPATPTPRVRRAMHAPLAEMAGTLRAVHNKRPGRGTPLWQPLVDEGGRVVYTLLRPLPVPRLLALHPRAHFRQAGPHAPVERTRRRRVAAAQRAAPELVA